MKTRILILVLIIFAFISIYYAGATETQIFYDDFESNIENWELEKGWSVIPDNGNKILKGTQHTFAATYLDGIVNKLELKLKLLQGAIHITVRSKATPEGLNRYFIGLNEGSSYIQKQFGNDFQELKSGGQAISLNEWHDIKIEIIGKKINVFSNGNLIVWAEDEDFLQEGDISFETHDNSIAHIDNVKVETSVPAAREFKAQDLFLNREYKGDLTLEGRDSLILENGEFEQFGNIYLKDKSKLIIRDSTFKITRYQRLLNHWGVHLQDRASLEIENSKLISGDGTLFVIHARDNARVNMRNSPTKIHLFTIFGNAKAVVENSEIIGDIGGLVGAFEKADVKLINSKVGAVNLYIPSGAAFEASGLGTGFFEKWNLYENAKVSGINYNITLINTELIKDTIGPGPFERGWPIFIESDARVKLKDSELRKVVITLRNEKAEFADFSLETYTNFSYRDITLENVIVKGQWGIFLHGSSDVIIRDSDAFWTFVNDNSRLTLINTRMNEFDPRNFHGEMIFENSRWDTAAEILENNDFIMRGSLEIGYIGGFSWESSNVTRIYDLIGKPNSELILRKNEGIVWRGKTNNEGKASFSIKFDDATFDDSWLIQDNFGNENEITLFSKTPIYIQQSVVSKFIQKLKLAEPPSLLLKLVTSILVAVVLIIFFLFFRHLKKKK